jgi:hypothetical protein
MSEPSALQLKSKHLWPVVDSWGSVESDEPDSQRWIIKAMVDDLRALEAELAAATENDELAAMFHQLTAGKLDEVRLAVHDYVAKRLLAERGEWEPVPDGIYGNASASGGIAWRVWSGMAGCAPMDGKLYVGKLPDGWQLMRRKAGTEEVQP